MKLKTILDTLETLGAKTYYVGGYVRDEILGIESKDIDVEIFNITEETFNQALSELGILVDSVGEQFSVYKVKTEDGMIDFSFPRTEVKTGTKHTDFEITVSPFISPFEASLRRDLTINALMKDTQTGEILDFHDGLVHLEEKIIKHTSSKFAEDPLRVYRIAQFAARFEGFTVDKETMEIASLLDLDEISTERVYEELYKVLMKSKFPGKFFLILKEMNQLDTHFPLLAIKDMVYLEMLSQRMKEIKESYIKELDKEYIAQQFTLIFSGSKPSITDDKYICKYVETVSPSRQYELFLALRLLAKGKKSKRAETIYGMTEIDALSIIHDTDKKIIPIMKVEFPKYASLLDSLDKLYEERKKEFISGADLIALGYSPSPEFSKLLKCGRSSAFSGEKKETILRKLKLSEV